MLSARLIRERLISSGVCQPTTLEGYTDLQIQEIERRSGLSFPMQYREFLRAAGKNAPGFFDGSIVCGDEALSLNDGLAEELELDEHYRRELRASGLDDTSNINEPVTILNGTRLSPEHVVWLLRQNWRPPENIFVFYCHGGYQWDYFKLDAGDDPPVYDYYEHKEPEIVPALSEWIARAIDGNAAMRRAP